MQDYLDRSNYFRGILVIVAKDRKISEEERKYVMDVGAKLGFEKKFCQSAINEILDNQFIEIQPPVFYDKKIAEEFITDGINLAYADSNFHPKEIEFLKDTAVRNGFKEEWFIQKISKVIEELNR
jgi:hypothetical protein